MSCFRIVLIWFCLATTGAGAFAAPVTLESETASNALLEDLRRELPGGEPPATVFEARREARRAAAHLTDYLNSRGYFDPSFDQQIDPGPPIIARLRVDPGPRFTLGTIEMDTGPSPLTEAAMQALQSVMSLRGGAPAIPSEILAQEAGLIAALRSVGYAEADARDRTVLGNRDSAELNIQYNLVPGPRIVFGEVVFPDGTPIRRSYLDRLVPFEAGDLYTPDRMAELGRRLNATRMFQVASARLSETRSGVTDTGEDIRDILITLEPRPRYTLSGGASFSTSEGPGLTASLTRRNASRRGDTITAALTVAALERAFTVDWRIPNILDYGRTFVGNLQIEREETDAFDRDALTVAAALETRVNRTLTYTLGATSEFTRETDSFDQRDQQVLSANAATRLDHADDPLDPTSGWRLDGQVEPGVVIGDRSAQFTSLNGQVSAYQGFGPSDRVVLAGRVRSGFVFGADLDDLPVSRRFYAGGGGSARGFEFQSVGPSAEDGTPTGGRGLLEFSGELRWRRERPLGFVAFIDGASVNADETVDFGDLQFSAGLGIRYRTPVGPVRFDVATPIDPRPGDDPVQLYISIGQAF